MSTDLKIIAVSSNEAFDLQSEIFLFSNTRHKTGCHKGSSVGENMIFRTAGKRLWKEVEQNLFSKA
jgi:hypothetical protein